MRFILALIHYRIFVQDAITLITFILGGIPSLFLAFRKGTSPGLLILGNPKSCITVRVNPHRLLGSKYFDLRHISFLVILNLQVGQEITPFFVVKVVIVLVFFLYLVLHGLWDSVLSLKSNIILRELFVAYGLIFYIILIPVIQRLRRKLINIQHPVDAIGMLDNV